MANADYAYDACSTVRGVVVHLQALNCRGMQGYALNTPGEGLCSRKAAGQTRTLIGWFHICIHWDIISNQMIVMLMPLRLSDLHTA
jgi:hypothetical protein